MTYSYSTRTKIHGSRPGYHFSSDMNL